MLDEIKEKASKLMETEKEKVKETVDKAKDALDPKKGKKAIENVKEKVQDFVADKCCKK